MLSALSVRNIVLIDQLDLALDTGLTALTGETGAGKSILLDALTLALGGRGDASLVRAGAESGQVVAVLQLPREHPAREALRENAIADDEDIILRRVQFPDGRTRAFINDQPVSAGLLQAIGSLVVEIHGQHDDRALVDVATHRAALDAFGGHEAMASAVYAAHETLVEANAATDATARLRCQLALRLVLLQIHAAAQAPLIRTDGTKLAAALLAVKENPGLPWTVPEMAALAGLSVSQAARRVRELTGHSPREFVIRARIDRARRLMEESMLSLKQIAETLGYTDIYFFHRQFKAVAGVTPARWRRERGL